MEKYSSRENDKLHFAVLATDVALFTLRGSELLVRLIKVNRPPHFPNTKGLPGALIHPMETAEETALRVIKDKGKINAGKLYMEQLYTFSALERDKRGRVVAVAYLSFVPWEKLSPEEQGSDDTVWWQPAARVGHMAYDHDEMLAMAQKRLRSRIAYTTLISKLMPDEFTLTELERAYETVTEKPLDKRNFRKKILKVGVLQELPHKRKGGRSRPAQLYRFASKKVEEIEVL